jgi:hypothetical protein
MIGLVAITVSEDEQRSIPNFGDSDPVRRAIDFSGEIEGRRFRCRRTIDQREREQQANGQDD